MGSSTFSIEERHIAIHRKLCFLTFQIRLWREGSTRTLEDMKNAGQHSKLVFQEKINDYLLEAYTLHNLEPGSVYKVQVSLKFKDMFERQLSYWPSLKQPNGELKNIDSDFRYFNTSQKPIDQFIKEDLDLAREQKRQVSRKIQFVKSERVLYDFARD